jgi:hypothetical protein
MKLLRKEVVSKVHKIRTNAEYSRKRKAAIVGGYLVAGAAVVGLVLYAKNA